MADMTPEEGSLDWMQSLPGDEMAFEIHRDSKPGETFSAAAMEELHGTMRTFIGARLLHHWTDAGGAQVAGPRRMRIDLKVTIDGESVAPEPGEEPWFKIDGSRRAPVQ